MSDDDRDGHGFDPRFSTPNEPTPPDGTPVPAGIADVTRPRTHRLVIALASACAFFLLTSVGLGVALVAQLNEGTSIAGPETTESPAPSPADAAPAPTVQDIPIAITSDLTFGEFALHTDDDAMNFYGIVTNEDPEQAVQSFHDVSIYNADGVLLDRSISQTNLLPGQTSIFNAYFIDNHPDIAEFRIEQTSYELGTPIATGDLRPDGFKADGRYMVAQLTSTMSVATEFAAVHIIGLIDDEIYAVCNERLDIPASGASFEAACYLNTASDTTEISVDALPDDAEFTVLFMLDQVL